MKRREMLRRSGAAAVGVGGLAVGGLYATDAEPSRGVTALVAGSLQAVAGRVPGAAVEAHGSLAVRRLVVEEARDPDAVALADPVLFDGLCDRVTLFATNALVLVYRRDSPVADLAVEDWRAAVRRGRVGRTDPAQDPLGYRTLMAMDLDPVLDRTALDGSVVLPETALLRTLEAGGLDAAVAYRNMAVEHDLPYVALPDAVDFSEPGLADHYRTATVDVGDRTVRGAPVRYAAAALADAGTAWVADLAGDAGRLRSSGLSVPGPYPRRTAVEALA